MSRATRLQAIAIDLARARQAALHLSMRRAWPRRLKFDRRQTLLNLNEAIEAALRKTSHELTVAFEEADAQSKLTKQMIGRGHSSN